MLQYWIPRLRYAKGVIGAVVILLWLASCSSSSSSLCPSGSPVATNGILANCSNHVTAPLSITSVGLPAGVVGNAYKTSLFQASGGTGGYMWSWSAAAGSSLPPGLSLVRLALTPPGQGDQAYITGTPTVAGTYHVVVSVTDFGSPPQHTVANYAIVISP